MVRRPLSQRLRLSFRPSIHREEEVVRTYHPSPVCIYLSLACGHADLCVLNCKFVVGQANLRAYSNQLDGFSSSVYICDCEFFPP